MTQHTRDTKKGQFEQANPLFKSANARFMLSCFAGVGLICLVYQGMHVMFSEGPEQSVVAPSLNTPHTFFSNTMTAPLSFFGRLHNSWLDDSLSIEALLTRSFYNCSL